MGGFFTSNGAQEKTRTSTVLLPLGPEPSASTNSATWALKHRDSYTFVTILLYCVCNRLFKRLALYSVSFLIGTNFILII